MKSANSCLSLSWTRAARNAAPSRRPEIIRIGGVADQAPEPLGDARIVLSEFGRLLAQDRELLVIEPQEFAVHRSEPVELDLTGVELHLSDELHRNLDRLRPERRADEKSYPELVRRHRIVPPGLDRTGHEPGLESRSAVSISRATPLTSFSSIVLRVRDGNPKLMMDFRTSGAVDKSSIASRFVVLKSATSSMLTVFLSSVSGIAARAISRREAMTRSP